MKWDIVFMDEHGNILNSDLLEFEGEFIPIPCPGDDVTFDGTFLQI